MAIKTPIDSIILLPRDILPHIKSASAEELKILIYLFAHPEANIVDAARETGVTVAKAESAVSFWRGAGVFAEAEAKKKAVAQDTSVYRNYDSATLSKAYETNSDFALICQLASEKLEKQLTKNDMSSLFYLYDFASLPAPLICAIIEDCCANGKKSPQYVFKRALGLYEDGIDDYNKFEQYLAKRELLNSNIGKLRRLCGLGERALSSKESKTFERWFTEWAFPFETVELAYEKTVDAKGSFSVAYINGILQRWHDSGFVTADDVKNGDIKKTAGTDSSLESDEFIEAALTRGFEDLLGDKK